MTVIDPSVMMAGGGSETPDFLYFYADEGSLNAGDYTYSQRSFDGSATSVYMRNRALASGFKSRLVTYQIMESTRINTQIYGADTIYENVAVTHEALQGYLDRHVHTNHVGTASLTIGFGANSAGRTSATLTNSVSVQCDGEAITVPSKDLTLIGDMVLNTSYTLYLGVIDFNLAW